MTFESSLNEKGDVVIIRCPQRLANDTSGEFKIFIRNLVEAGQARIVIDLSPTDFVDSSGLGAIVSRIAASRALHGDIRLAGAGEFVSNLLEITHLNKVNKAFPDVAAALNSFEQP